MYTLEIIKFIFLLTAFIYLVSDVNTLCMCSNKRHIKVKMSLSFLQYFSKIFLIVNIGSAYSKRLLRVACNNFARINVYYTRAMVKLIHVSNCYSLSTLIRNKRVVCGSHR